MQECQIVIHAFALVTWWTTAQQFQLAEQKSPADISGLP